ncbi:hypothetical protein LCGC14_2179780 [marine sediment metagenome]|uniref:Uncharacterized protein n=1 Tax=marine sediment metagenome TaxID=412755 RepID=A0A0F9E9U1_9ZZZZ
MKVKIVDKKDDVKEMTIEELAEHEFIGYVWGENKYIISQVGSGFPNNRFSGVSAGLHRNASHSSSEKIQDCDMKIPVLRDFLRGLVRTCELQVFKTDKELYLWMAE